MLLNRLLDHFDPYTRLHIEVNAVRDQLIDMGVQDEIAFHFVSLEDSVLRGLIYRYIRHNSPYGDPIFCSEICIADSLSHEWQRLVAVKELIHITDTPAETANSEAAVENLIERLSMPTEIREETPCSWNDRTHIVPALAVLVPKSCRETLRQLHVDGHITHVDVATMAKIPSRFAELVINESFEQLVDALRQINGSR